MSDDVNSTVDLVETTAAIVSAYVSRNSIPMSDLPVLIRSVHDVLGVLGTGAVPEPAPEALRPAVSVKKSVTDDAIICLEDGRRFKSLKRHLMSAYGMTPQDYRTKWGLPKDYPMVAPSYASARSALAKTMGLGRKAAAPAAEAAPDDVEPEPAPKGRGRA